MSRLSKMKWIFLSVFRLIPIRLSSFVLLSLLTGFGDCYGQQNPTITKPKRALQNYVDKLDTSFNFQDYHRIKDTDGTFYEVNLVSQTWQSITWRHRLIIYFPKAAKYSATMLIVLRHIYNRNGGMASLETISDATGTPSAMLYDVPNQPLFDGMEEDDLQAYTFSQYIKTGDESWPLLFPMVKSVVRAMDLIQILSQKENGAAVNDFVVAGHSKRGHTTWLTAAADERVKGIVPIAIDVLNSSAQMPHHLETFGEYSTPSVAATDFIKELGQPRGQNLIEMIDAYSYKEQLMLPKLIISATNDQFFTTDALNLYWDGLKQPKAVLYLSNADHGRADTDPRINPTAFAFVRAVAAHKNLPALEWKYEKYENQIILKIKSDSSAARARLWKAYSSSKDFRQALWTSQPMSLKPYKGKISKGTESLRQYQLEINMPNTGYMAIFGEVEFTQDRHTFLLSTQTNISPNKR